MAKKRLTHHSKRKGTQVPQRGLHDRVASVEKTTLRTDLPAFGPGDTIRVHARIKEGDKERIQIFEGTVIAQSGKSASRSFVVRKMSHGVGVERIFLETSPKIAKIELVQSGRVRRAKLYYIREREGKSAKIDREVETIASAAQSAAAKEANANKKH